MLPLRSGEERCQTETEGEGGKGQANEVPEKPTP